MPVVNIEVWEGRTEEQKQDLISKVTKAVAESLGIPGEAVTIVIHEVPKQNWGIGGKQASKMKF